MSSKLRDSLARDGFVVIPSLLSPTQLSSLRAASLQTTSLARDSGWRHIRTLPKQFPPWTSDPSAGIWGVQHLLHPDLPTSPTFIQNYFSDEVLDPVKELLECEDEDLVMELFNLLVRPERNWSLRWHRDNISADATPEEELEILRNSKGNHAQWNLALYDDSSLIVIPGSHSRARTSEERLADPYAPTLTSMLVVTLKAGDCVFYNNNILHRGVYESSKERMTLHGSVGTKGHGVERARNVLQHGIGDYVDRVDLSSLGEVGSRLRDRAEGMRSRAVEMGKG
ncbi:hypothetical protein P7C70_g530, partial [Phenoliferia sp. Uapishka_3]